MAQRINAALNEVLALPAVQARLQAQAMTALGGSPRAHAQRLDEARVGLSKLIQESGFQPQ